MQYTVSVSRNLGVVRERIANAALRSGRDPDDVHLVAVSKMFPCEAVVEAWAEGQRDFGENRPEEGLRKIHKLSDFEGDGFVWHMIGHVQSRKARTVLKHYDFLHSLDRMRLAEKLSRLAVEIECEIPVLLECNVSGEASKYGFDLAEWQEDTRVLEAFEGQVEAILKLPGVQVQGLMTMAPIVDDPNDARPVFVSLRGLRDALKTRFPKVTWKHLSMGMTDDFEVAIEEGATMVRIGRAIFGEYS